MCKNLILTFRKYKNLDLTLNFSREYKKLNLTLNFSREYKNLDLTRHELLQDGILNLKLGDSKRVKQLHVLLLKVRIHTISVREAVAHRVASKKFEE